jgi:SAM-dependent methyltransferase/uncharacterized protein YbaR (Trm112 family)
MRSEALELLVCPRCGGALVADAEAPAADGHILGGELGCACGARYPITGGVPRLLPDSEPMSVEVGRRFGASWSIFDHRSRYHEQQFLDWVAPLQPADFVGKTILEAGCGKGRHSALMASWGAESVVALDLGPSVDIAFRDTRHLANVHVVQGDLTQPPVARAFDLGIAVGVLHHLPDPAAGFRAVAGRVRPGGRVSVWVYGREGNDWIVYLVDPLRRAVTSRMPEELLYWLSLPPTAALGLLLRAYRFRILSRRLPYGEYLHYISRFPLREVHNIVYDQLVTPVTYYLRESDVRAWFETPELADLELAWHNKNSWRAAATVTGERDAGRAATAR